MHKSKTRPLTRLLIPAVLCLFISVAVNAQQATELFSYRELVQLYEQETLPDALQNKLHRLLTTDPASFGKLIDSTAYPRGSSKWKLIREQIALMKQADVIVLNEVDRGAFPQRSRHALTAPWRWSARAGRNCDDAR